MVVTIAVNEPADVGLVEKVTVSDVAVAVVTVPTAPLLNCTVLLPAFVLKPVPAIVTVFALAARLAVLLVTVTGTVATCTAVPLLTLLLVTMAVRLPAAGLVEKVTVSEVAVALVTVPTAPLFSTTVLLAGVVLKPVPAMVMVAAELDRLAVLNVTVGVTVATFTAAPLLMLLVVTIAVRLPADGRVENVTVSEVAVAAVTVPTAPLLKTTVLLAAVVLKPVPVIVTVLELDARLVLTWVTVGLIVDTCTAEPLLTELVVTTAVKLPSAAGLFANVTVNDVVVAEVTVPVAPLLKVTELLPAVALKPKPAMTTVLAVIEAAVVLTVTTGMTVATCTAAPLLTPPTATIAVKLPAEVGLVENVTSSDVAVAAVTVPTAPLLSVTVLLAAVGLKPVPAMVTVVELAARLAVALVTVGVSLAT